MRLEGEVVSADDVSWLCAGDFIQFDLEDVINGSKKKGILYIDSIVGRVGLKCTSIAQTPQALVTELVQDVTSETKPCPYCNNEENRHRSLMAWVMSSVTTIHYVKCEGCAACGPLSLEFKSEEDAILNWNERVEGKVDLY